MVASAVLDRIFADRIVPVVVPGDPVQMAGLAQALTQSGLGSIEITLRTPQAIDAIAVVAKSDLLVGAGTVLSIEQAERAVDAGARFLVSPGFDENVIEWARNNDVPMVAGIATVSEAMSAVRSGKEFVKLFPAEPLGGVSMIKAMAAVLPDLKIMPTGGVTIDNLSDYLSLSAVGAIGGTWIAPAADIASGDFAAIADRAKVAVAVRESLA